MRIHHIAAMLASFGASAIDAQRRLDEQYLNDSGWICLGAEAVSGQVHWTNRERGLGEGGPVTFQRALWLQRTADALKRRKNDEAPGASDAS